MNGSTRLAPFVASMLAAIVVAACGDAEPVPVVTDEGLAPVVTAEGFLAITSSAVRIAEMKPPKPAYSGLAVSQPFGTRIRRITGDPDTPIVTPSGDVIGMWTAVSRHHYVTTQAWNADGSLMHIYLGREEVSPNNLILSGGSYQPLYAYYASRRDSRWHPTDPAIRVVIAGDTLSWQNVETSLIQRTWQLPYEQNIAGGKWNVSADGRYLGIVGDNRYIYAFDMSTKRGRAGPPFDLRTDCGLPSCDPPNKWVDLRTASDALHFLVHYGPESNWRVLRADATTLAISHRVFPSSLRPAECDAGLICSPGLPADGFLPVLFGHPDFLVNTDGSMWVVGQSKYWSKKTGSAVDTVNGKSGAILGINIDAGAIKSLTDPDDEAWATHVSVRSTQRPGWVYASYNRAPLGKFMGEILAVNLNDLCVERYAHHFSATQGCYDCEVHPSPSPDGSKVAFASTWGEDQSLVQGYVLELLADPD